MGIQLPVGDLVLRPPFGFLQRELISGLFTGSGDLARPTGALPPFNNVNAYGLTWSFFTVPPEIGRTLGDPVVYQPRMIQLSTVHTGADGHDTVSEVFDARVEGFYWRWLEPGPTRVHFEILPGVEVTFYWLIVRFP